MPLGNLTSQFFANVYLNELDYFVKHKLKVKYYIRYVDDFVILHNSKSKLKFYKKEINQFLLKELKVELHPDKSKIISLADGVPMLGFRIFYHNRILRKKAIRRIRVRLKEWKELKEAGILERDSALEKLLGWIAYAVNCNTYYLRKSIIEEFDKIFLI